MRAACRHTREACLGLGLGTKSSGAGAELDCDRKRRPNPGLHAERSLVLQRGLNQPPVWKRGGASTILLCVLEDSLCPWCSLLWGPLSRLFAPKRTKSQREGHV